MVNADTMIQYLLDEKIGEYMRLTDMLKRYQNGKKLYNSDLAYITNLYPKDEEEPVTFSEETFLFDEIPKVRNNHVRKVLLIIMGIILLTVAAFVFLLVFTNLLYFHGSPLEGFCDFNQNEYCVEKPITHEYLCDQLSNIYDVIVGLLK